MNARMQVGLLPGDRLHLNDGPIDLVIGATGAAADLQRAREAAIARFATILDELCGELALLRAPMAQDAPALRGPVARRMADAVRPLSARCFITSMAAVAGAVADEILAHMVAAAPLERCYVNNGGDIAFHLADGASYRIGLIDRPDRPGVIGQAEITSSDPVRGVATSGRHGRSFSLGIADAVTILARTAAAADAAATLVANAVDLPGHAAVERAPARDLDPQSDLGARLVTRHVGPLTADEIARALQAGANEAEHLLARGALAAAALSLAGERRIVGGLAGATGETHLAAPVGALN